MTLRPWDIVDVPRGTDRTVCPHRQKAGFATRKLAKRALRQHRNAPGGSDRLHVYRCVCGLFHIGHKTPAHQRRQAAA